MADNFLLKLYSLRRFKISREGCHGKDSHVSVPRWCQSSGHQKTLKCRKIQTQEIAPYLREKEVSNRCFAETLDLRAPQNKILRYQA